MNSLLAFVWISLVLAQVVMCSLPNLPDIGSLSAYGIVAIINATELIVPDVLDGATSIIKAITNLIP
ncbi:hypothetical protein CHUAL_008372 [Chamberlinius hualienensis]